MKAKELFKKIEEIVPKNLAVDGDKIGFIGKDLENLEVKKVLVSMDYVPTKKLNKYDLLILHHPPLSKPEIPAYVIHSNWDVVKGGACDALAETLNMEIKDVLDEDSGIGRLCKIKAVSLPEFIKLIKEKLSIDNVKVVNFDKNLIVEYVAIVSGFGLSNERLVKKAYEKNADVYLSGDLIYKTMVLAYHLNLTLIDATHYFTELPGLYKLAKIISNLGIEVDIADKPIKWDIL
ncbi:protein of unknown function DUF34 [Methanothermus fervidus DSM 2088]|uniref:NGG1p interacting factor 3 protein, NIF3 n=1 Tax=Methanothermus fervidus (strain ATCC 43054 / DSM 2088 / JCM 10308 / V24 S) TaxID=523846 RepID=E3GZ36_METFV|nr:Nif3-like dinuclear metal center hexameric protein [Methanothermus fervidus]ADP77568.1 protein of unknown function DUF34 [Methanothermus fervidus DSM 2088]